MDLQLSKMAKLGCKMAMWDCRKEKLGCKMARLDCKMEMMVGKQIDWLACYF